MKKLLFILLTAAVFAACKDNEDVKPEDTFIFGHYELSDKTISTSWPEIILNDTAIITRYVTIQIMPRKTVYTAFISQKCEYLKTDTGLFVVEVGIVNGQSWSRANRYENISDGVIKLQGLVYNKLN